MPPQPVLSLGCVENGVHRRWRGRRGCCRCAAGKHGGVDVSHLGTDFLHAHNRRRAQRGRLSGGGGGSRHERQQQQQGRAAAAAGAGSSSSRGGRQQQHGRQQQQQGRAAPVAGAGGGSWLPRPAPLLPPLSQAHSLIHHIPAPQSLAHRQEVGIVHVPAGQEGHSGRKQQGGQSVGERWCRDTSKAGGTAPAVLQASPPPSPPASLTSSSQPCRPPESPRTPPSAPGPRCRQGRKQGRCGVGSSKHRLQLGVLAAGRGRKQGRCGVGSSERRLQVGVLAAGRKRAQVP